MGHHFDEKLRCEPCRRTWHAHQSKPQPCDSEQGRERRARDARRAGKLQQQRRAYRQRRGWSL